MYTLIFKDNDRKEYKVTAANIFTVWYAMGKYISIKYQVRITREILNLRKWNNNGQAIRTYYRR